MSKPQKRWWITYTCKRILRSHSTKELAVAEAKYLNTKPSREAWRVHVTEVVEVQKDNQQQLIGE